MPQMTVNGTELHYDETGSGPEAVVMAHGLLLSGRMFDGVVAGLSDRYRCVTFDFRGQGQSAVSPEEPTATAEAIARFLEPHRARL